ncbi:MAG: hypothetical protein BWZ02_02273 [Lentisphaerae bacterium ADurb.BinA184]|nr:MAG: hypothetical protein BWZ02_02273 [Lentisphaerae bacterium ADurb.BinA184]
MALPHLGLRQCGAVVCRLDAQRRRAAAKYDLVVPGGRRGLAAGRLGGGPQHRPVAAVEGLRDALVAGDHGDHRAAGIRRDNDRGGQQGAGAGGAPLGGAGGRIPGRQRAVSQPGHHQAGEDEGRDRRGRCDHGRLVGRRNQGSGPHLCAVPGQRIERRLRGHGVDACGVRNRGGLDRRIGTEAPARRQRVSGTHRARPRQRRIPARVEPLAFAGNHRLRGGTRLRRRRRRLDSRGPGGRRRARAASAGQDHPCEDGCGG